MSCYRPLRAVRSKGPSGLRFLDAKENLEVQWEGADRSKVLHLPCSKCVGCRMDRALSWTVRIMHEASLYEHSSFLTLTYSDESLPHGDVPTLDKRDLVLFNKRVRRSLGRHRYYGVGEYGSVTHRPHYHEIVFGWRPKFTAQVTANTFQSEELDKLWSRDGKLIGNATVGDVTYASAAYVAQYSLKKQYGIAEREQGRAHEFSVMSQGIGKDWCDKWSKDLDRGYVIHNGKRVRMPRYYKERKGDRDWEWYLLQKLAAREFRGDMDAAEQTDERMRVKEVVHTSRRQFFNGDREPGDVAC